MLQKITTTNSRFAIVGVLCSEEIFVVVKSFVLRINICGENRNLRQALNRYLQA